MLSQRQIFLRHLAQTSDIPLFLEIEKAEGVYLYDQSGKKYLDLISGISVSNLGHRHPAIIDAIQKQLDKYLHLMVYGEFVQSPQTEFAKLLTDHLPENLNTVYFTNSGAEATEGAMKLAKRATGRTQIISFKDAYHGSTQGALSIAGDEWLKNAFRPLLPDTLQLKYNSFEDLEEITERTAAVFAEPIQSEAGGRLPEEGFLKTLRERCTEVGALLVFDEIQIGMGRTGKLWGMQHTDVIPDVILLGKALGGGMPLGAFITSRDLMGLLSHDPVLGHITTFGGHPVCCAAGKAAFQVLLESDLISQIERKENLFREKLQHPKIKALHGKGLLLALDLGSFDAVQKVIRYCIEKGVITDWFLFNSECIRIAPPLVISEEEIEFACEVILEGVNIL